MTHDVALAFSARPRYPDRCVLCGVEHPDSQARISVLVARPASSSLLDDGLNLALGVSNNTAGSNIHLTLTPPACTRCCAKVRWQARLYLIGQYLGPLAGVVLLVWGLYAGHSYLGYTGLALGICTPVIWSLLYPPALGATSVGGQLLYEFRSARFAEEFRQLNVVTPAAAA